MQIGQMLIISHSRWQLSHMQCLTIKSWSQCHLMDMCFMHHLCQWACMHGSIAYYGHPNIHIPPPPVRSHGSLSTGQHVIPVEEWDISNPASSSPPPTCKLEQYCYKCGHNAEIQNKLEEVGFVPSNNLANTPSDAYEKAGFKYFEWQYVLKADKKFLRQ